MASRSLGLSLRSLRTVVGIGSLVGLGWLALFADGSAKAQKPAVEAEYTTDIRPLLAKFCLDCHSTKDKKGSLDLERFTTAGAIRKDLKVWQSVIEQVEAGEMPPRGKPQPSDAERKRLLGWSRGFLDAEARARAGDPGFVPLRRLSHAEYDYTVHDLTGVDLRPTREFPAEGAAGEGFTNAAEALTEISPALFTKYLNAAKEIADHAVLLPEGFRFSPSKTRRDWTDEDTTKLRQFYAAYATGEGRLTVPPYLAASVRHRDALLAGRLTTAEVAAREKLNPKYFGLLWKALTGKTPSHPLDGIRKSWRIATEKDIPKLAEAIANWQKTLWRTVRIGSYFQPIGKGYGESLTRQIPAAPVLPPREDAAARLAGEDEFRRVFPLFLCFPQVVPTDEVVSLKMFHREDEPLVRLFLDDADAARLDRLWAEHRFVSRQPVAENDYLPQFIGFVTQDQPKAMLAYIESQRPAFQQRADAFRKAEEAAVPKQLDALWRFVSRAYRRPLREHETADLLALYSAVRAKGATHEEAFRGVLTRVLVAPAFLFRIEQAPKGTDAGPVTDTELATRLSYFLWSGPPDDELRHLAATGRLHEPQVLAAQVQRMLRDDRVRRLAIEFGTQSLHVRGFDAFQEKNEKLFPSFDANLRKAMYEESILFFLDLFRSDRAVTQLLDADHTFLDETLAKHYGIPGVTGPQWRKVDGVRKHGRGGVLGLASVQARQSGASRTSPVLRGNWVVETLLGEKLPRPPANVPPLPETEGADKLTMRELVEKHARAPECAVCHVRIDPFGFALEKYDPIGRLRSRDLGGQAVDTRAKLKDGTEFEGLDGLRHYLLTKKQDVVVRLFCRRLLGYALGRAVTLSDTALLDEMMVDLNKHDGRVSVAIQAIVRSPQFRNVRGSDFGE